MPPLQRWRARNNLTQVEGASLLGVSQPYLSLLEKGARPLTPVLRSRMRGVGRSTGSRSADDLFRAQLSALEYPAFSHVARSRSKPEPEALLLSILAEAQVDARVADALPWLVRNYDSEMNFAWLVRQAKLRDLQNRLGFVLALSGVQTKAAAAAMGELERARLLEEATLCWDAMPQITRDWMRMNRSALAEHWNILTRMDQEGVPDAA